MNTRDTRENSEIPTQPRELTRELTTDEIEVVSGGWLMIATGATAALSSVVKKVGDTESANAHNI